MSRKQVHWFDAKRTRVMPLDEFPAAEQARIARLVAQSDPPPRWKNLALAQIESRAWYEWYWQRGLRPARDSISPSLRRAVIARDGYVCAICEGAVAPDDMHIDHRVPVVRGGPTLLSNLQVTHAVCNMRKAAR